MADAWRVWARDAVGWVRAIPALPAVLAGVGGGVAMAAYLMVAMVATGHGALAPLRQIGASHPFGGTLVAGVAMHFVTAAFWGSRLGELLEHAPRRFLRPRAALALGLAWGVTLWLVMGLVIGPLFSPEVAEVDPGHYFVAHVVYGATSTLALASHLRRR